jgi:sugar (pentulose or hexulose) kinase
LSVAGEAVVTSPPLVVGIDIGTSGARALVVDSAGRVVAQAFEALPAPQAIGLGREQDAECWWRAAARASREAVASLAASGADPARIAAVCVDATSGTIVPVDDRIRPIGPGLMYNDGRAAAEADRLAAVARAGARGGAMFNASYAAAKILWLRGHVPSVAFEAARFLHQADLVNARLLGATRAADVATDEANALKTGYDPVARRWSAALPAAGIDLGQLPSVVPTGTTLGPLGSDAARETGLPAGCSVVAGMTDGTAAAVASGASRIGEGNTTLGTTLVWKVITDQAVVDPEGRLYCHRHPGGGFLPGGAGNAGGEGIARQVLPDDPHPGEGLDRLAREFADGPPSGLLAYPLPRPGERFPFVDPAFAGFADPRAPDAASRYRAALEGLACIERWGFEVAASLGAAADGPVWTTGMGARHPKWMQLRADFLGRPVCRAAHPESGFGSALVAAMNAWYAGDWAATAKLVTVDFRCEPRRTQRARCDQQYGEFRAACRARRGDEATHG